MRKIAVITMVVLMTVSINKAWAAGSQNTTPFLVSPPQFANYPIQNVLKLLHTVCTIQPPGAGTVGDTFYCTLPVNYAVNMFTDALGLFFIDTSNTGRTGFFITITSLTSAVRVVKFRSHEIYIRRALVDVYSSSVS